MKVPVSVSVNGRAIQRDVEPRLLLVHFLRDVAGLTGTKIGCDTSQCGACTVLLDGMAVKACTCLAVQADGASVTTVEGLGAGTALHPLQEAFWEKHGLQCGFCTPGFLMLATWMLEREEMIDEARLRHVLSSNLCRCTGYQNILAAVRAAARELGRWAEGTESAGT